MSEDYKLIAAKRAWVPEWLWWIACAHIPTIQFKQIALCWPFRWLLTEEPE